MKKNTTYVSRDAIMALVEASGCTVTDKAAWSRVNGAKGRRLYIPKTKTVGRIDLANLGFTGEGVRDLGGESFGSVTQQVDFSRTEPEILSTIAHVLEHMAGLPELEPKPRAKRATPADPVVASSPEDKKAARLARAALIAKVAAEKGAPVSPLLAADMEELATEEEIALLPDAE